MKVALIIFLFSLTLVITMAMVVNSDDFKEQEKIVKAEKSVMQTKCSKRGGKVVWVRDVGDICVIDIDKEMK